MGAREYRVRVTKEGLDPTVGVAIPSLRNARAAASSFAYAIQSPAIVEVIDADGRVWRRWRVYGGKQLPAKEV